MESFGNRGWCQCNYLICTLGGVDVGSLKTWQGGSRRAFLNWEKGEKAPLFVPRVCFVTERPQQQAASMKKASFMELSFRTLLLNSFCGLLS